MGFEAFQYFSRIQNCSDLIERLMQLDKASLNKACEKAVVEHGLAQQQRKVQQATKALLAALAAEKQRPQPRWILCCRQTVGSSMKDHFLAIQTVWDVYQITCVLRGWMKEVFAERLKVRDHDAKEVMFQALQAQQARTERAHGRMPSEHEVLNMLLHLSSVMELCLGKTRPEVKKMNALVRDAQGLLYHSNPSSVISEQLAFEKYRELVPWLCAS